MKLIENKSIDIDILYTKLTKQFPKTEMKDKNIFGKILQNRNYRVMEIVEGEICCGICTFFEFKDNTILVDYFAIYPQYHSKGYGSGAFNFLINKSKYNGCYLEVEKENPQDINTGRRIKFYENLGAKLLDINYYYPNKYGNLPMNLYFLSFKNNYYPSKEHICANIKSAFDNLHFDLDNTNSVYELICR